MVLHLGEELLEILNEGRHLKIGAYAWRRLLVQEAPFVDALLKKPMADNVVEDLLTLRKLVDKDKFGFSNFVADGDVLNKLGINVGMPLEKIQNLL